MANNPTVTLTFAGDTKQVTKSTSELGDATDKLREKIDKNSTQMTRDTQTSTDRIRSSHTQQQRAFVQTAETFEEMIDRMAKAKRRADSLQANMKMLGFEQQGSMFRTQANQEGQASGESFSSGFSSGVKGTFGKLAGPAVVVGLAVVARLAGDAGLLLGGGIVTGIGAGMAAAGLTVAAKSPEVIAHFERLKVNVQAKMMQISKPFEQTLIDAAAAAQRVFNSFAPELDAAFPQMAQDISEFIFNLQEAFRQLAPMIQPVADAFGKILDSLGPQLPGVFQNIANALIPLAETVGENADGFATMVVWMLNLIPVAIDLIRFIINFGIWWHETWAGVVQTVVDVWNYFADIAADIGDIFSRMGDFVSGVFDRIGDALKQRARNMLSDISNWPAQIKGALGDVGRILWDAGWRIVGGLIDGLKARFGEVMSTLRGLTSSFPSWKGPADVDARLLVESGELIIGGLVTGLKNEEPAVQDYLAELTRFIGGFGPEQASYATPVPSQGRGEPRMVRLGSDGSRVGDAMLDLIQEAIRGRGGDPSVLGV